MLEHRSPVWGRPLPSVLGLGLLRFLVERACLAEHRSLLKTSVFKTLCCVVTQFQLSELRIP